MWCYGCHQTTKSCRASKGPPNVLNKCTVTKLATAETGVLHYSLLGADSVNTIRSRHTRECYQQHQLVLRGQQKRCVHKTIHDLAQERSSTQKGTNATAKARPTFPANACNQLQSILLQPALSTISKVSSNWVRGRSQWCTHLREQFVSTNTRGHNQDCTVQKQKKEPCRTINLVTSFFLYFCLPHIVWVGKFRTKTD